LRGRKEGANRAIGSGVQRRAAGSHHLVADSLWAAVVELRQSNFALSPASFAALKENRRIVSSFTNAWQGTA
jgi:hypothetical protein